MTEIEYACWRCGAPLEQALFPLRREEVCPACDADLHVCKLCRFFNPSVSDACDEPIAAEVTNKERANFCDYLKPSPDAWRGAGSAADAALADLAHRADRAASGQSLGGAADALIGAIAELSGAAGRDAGPEGLEGTDRCLGGTPCE